MHILLNTIRVLLTSLSFLLMISSLCSCSTESDALLVDELDEEYQLYDYYVDKYGNEGIVVYKLNGGYSSNYPKGYKYIIVMSSDESLLPWGPMDEIILKKDSASTSEFRQPAIGITMLQSMYSKGIARYPAQQWCFEKNHSSEIGTSSWRLPSYYEMRQIFGTSSKNVADINHALLNTGGTLLDDSYHYWTCMEDYENYITINGVTSDYDQANRAVLTSPGNSTWGNKDRWLKKNRYYVRAIKYIYYYDH